VKIVVLTNGDKGSGNTSVTSAALAVTRAEEMHAAAAALNATAVLLVRTVLIRSTLLTPTPTPTLTRYRLNLTPTPTQL
jgi:LmbE family N-acetylglucosaminyl deacetylase